MAGALRRSLRRLDRAHAGHRHDPRPAGDLPARRAGGALAKLRLGGRNAAASAWELRASVGENSSDTATLYEFHEEARRLLQIQMRSIDALLHDLAPPTSDVVEVEPEELVLIWMLQAVGVSINSVLKLTDVRDMAIRDCFGIARSAAETAVNAAYIAVGGHPVAALAIRHMRQKRWRDLKREGRAGGHRVLVQREIDSKISDFPGLADAIAEFTNKKGGEIRDWTNRTIEQRIDQVHSKHERAGKLLGGAIFSIYRPSSELLHGTFYGVNYFWQGSLDAPVKSVSDFDHLWIEDHFVTLINALFFAASGVVEAVASERGFPSHVELQSELLAQLTDAMTKLSEAAGR